MVTLAIRRADSEGPVRVVSLDRPLVLLGRSPKCTICLKDPTVSRLHAAIKRHDDGTFSIVRRKAAQKVWVNGVSVDASPLRGGEIIRLGPYMIRFGPQESGPEVDDETVRCHPSVKPAASQRPATLVIEAGSPVTGTVPLVGPVTMIGRSDDCDVALVDATCSRRHFEIHRVDDTFVLRDLGSTNGVFLNGHRITSDTELAAEDIIEVGQARMRLVIDGLAEPSLPLAAAAVPAAEAGRPPVLRAVSSWKRWSAFWQVGTAATLAFVIVALFTVPALMARASKRAASATPREIAKKTSSKADTAPAAEEEASDVESTPVAVNEYEDDQPTTDSDADRDLPAETDASPAPPSAAPQSASDVAAKTDSTNESRQTAAPPRATLKDLLDQAEETPASDNPRAESTSSSKPETAGSRPLSGKPAADPPKTRLPVPPEDEVAAALKNVEAVFADELTERSKTASLLPKLLDAANKSSKPANKFALFLAAEREAVEASSFRAAVDAFNARAKAFDIDALQGRLDLLLNASKVKGDAAGDIFDLIVDVANEALATERFDIATKASVLAGNVAADIDQSTKVRGVGGGTPRSASPPDLSSGASDNPVEIARRLRYVIAETKKLLQKYETAVETLRETPDDEKSLEIVGKYRCFVMGDWRQGLPPLAACRDEPLCDLASRELALGSDGADTAAIFTLAGDWWSFAEAVKRSPLLPSEAAHVAKRHAADLYEKILADLADPLESELARKRIAAVAGEAPPLRLMSR